MGSFNRLIQIGIGRYACMVLSPLWEPGSIPKNWADVCGFLQPPDSDWYWKVRMHGAFSIVGTRIDSKQQGCRLWVPSTASSRLVLEGTHAWCFLHCGDPDRFQTTGLTFVGSFNRLIQIGIGRYACMVLSPLWGPGSIPNNWADVCGFLQPPHSDWYWKVRMHGAFSIVVTRIDSKQLG